MSLRLIFCPYYRHSSANIYGFHLHYRLSCCSPVH